MKIYSDLFFQNINSSILVTEYFDINYEIFIQNQVMRFYNKIFQIISVEIDF